MNNTFLKVSLITLISLGTHVYAGQKSWRKQLSTEPAGPYKAVKKVKLHYDMSWNGALKSGECVVEFDKNTGSRKTVKVSSYGKTKGLVRSIFPYDFKITSKYKGDTLKPVSFNIWEKTRSESKIIDGSFRGDKATSKEVTTPFDTKEKLHRSHEFQHKNLYDLYSGMLYVGSQPLKKGDKHSVIIYPFDRPHLAIITVKGRENHNGHPCIKLDLKMSKVNSDLTLKRFDKMKKATMWITDDSNRVLVDLRSDVFIGDVRVTLKKSEWD